MSWIGPSGRSDRIRTCDPLTPSQVRYQAALRSVRRGSALIGSGWPRGNRLGERRMRWVAVLGLLLALAATPAAAQPPTAAPSDQVASAAFEKGEAAYKAKDYAAAMSFFRIAADQGYAPAQSDLGYLYQTGAGVPADYLEAMRWYRMAAAQNLAAAQNQIGYLYQNALGVPQDYAEAMRWFQLSAAQGNPDAENNIGYL